MSSDSALTGLQQTVDRLDAMLDVQKIILQQLEDKINKLTEKMFFELAGIKEEMSNISRIVDMLRQYRTE